MKRGPKLSARQSANVRENMARLIEAAGSLEALARGLGVQKSLVQEAHRLGACSLPLALRVAPALGLTVEQLVNGPAPPEPMT